MIWKTLRAGALLASLSLASAAPALAGADAYVQYLASAGIDDACPVFRYTERAILVTLASEALWDTPQYEGWVRSSDDDTFAAWTDGLDARAAAMAVNVGCTQAANQILGPVRGAVAARLYQDLLLAVHFNDASQDEFERIELSPAEIAAANAFDAYLQQLYGQSFAAFSAAQKQAVSQIVLPPMNNDPSSFFFAPLSIEDMESRRAALEPLQFRARDIIRNALLEVSAESNGFAVRPWRGSGVVLVPRQAPDQRLAIIDTSHRFRSDEKLGPWMNGVLVRMPDRTLRLMTYGGESKFDSANAVLLVARGPTTYAGGTAASTSDPRWRAEALAFAGVPVSEGCLGQRCLAFPAEAHDAMLAIGRLDYAELWISVTGATAPPPGPVEGFRNLIFAAALHDLVSNAQQ